MKLFVGIDKSALHRLNREQIKVMTSHTTVAITSSLLIEILADKAKPEKKLQKGARPEVLFSKTGLIANVVADYLSIIDAEIKGKKIPTATKKINPSCPNTAAIITSNTNDKARWENGDFTEEDFALATEWRKLKSSLDFEITNRQNKDKIINFLKKINIEAPTTWTECRAMASLSVAADLQSNFSHSAHIGRFVKDGTTKSILNARWPSGVSEPWISMPYTFECMVMAETFLWAIANNIKVVNDNNKLKDIGPRSSHFTDLQYAFYLPFFDVFVSDDDMQLSLLRTFSREHQIIVRTSELTSFLGKIGQ